jgi:hypothetical protein
MFSEHSHNTKINGLNVMNIGNTTEVSGLSELIPTRNGNKAPPDDPNTASLKAKPSGSYMESLRPEKGRFKG